MFEQILEVLQNFVIWAMSDWKHLLIFAIIIVILDAIGNGRLPIFHRRKSEDDGDE